MKLQCLSFLKEEMYLVYIVHLRIDPSYGVAPFPSSAAITKAMAAGD